MVEMYFCFTYHLAEFAYLHECSMAASYWVVAGWGGGGLQLEAVRPQIVANDSTIAENEWPPAIW